MTTVSSEILLNEVDLRQAVAAYLDGRGFAGAMLNIQFFRSLGDGGFHARVGIERLPADSGKLEYESWMAP